MVNPIASFNAPGRQGGFTYLLLIFALAILGVGLATIGTLWSATVRQERRIQLEWVGTQYRDAIASYYFSSPGSVSVYPRSLDDLLEDKRYLTVKRHLRERYKDPMTDQDDWQIIPSADGGVAGVSTQGSSEIAARYFAFLPNAPLK